MKKFQNSDLYNFSLVSWILCSILKSSYVIPYVTVLEVGMFIVSLVAVSN